VPGRFEITGRQPLVVLDGAHNADGALALARTLDDDFGGRYPDVLVIGFTAGREPAEMLSILSAQRARRVIACRPNHPRGLDPDQVVAEAASIGVTVETSASVAEAVDRALAAAAPEEFVLITGSLYVVGDARRRIHHR
jgi:folylpolyglutamate synthase/dihydropteroate synthase